MKFRSDFVTNSSSANYTLVLRLQNEDELEAGAGFSVSPECAITMDGGMNGEDIGLDVPLEALFAELKECADIDAVIDLLCNHIEIEMWEDEEEKPNGVMRVMGKDRQKCTMEQAEMIAWRNVKDWIAAQIALVETEQASMQEVFLPYLVVSKNTENPQTLYERFASAQYMLPEANI